MTILTKHFAKVTILSVAIAATATPAVAQDSDPVYNLKASHYFKPGHPWDMGLTRFAERANELSDGKINVEIYSNGVLGNETDMLQNLREGILDFAVTDPSAGSTFTKELDFFALPFLFEDYQHWQETLDGDIGSRYAEVITEKADLKILGYWGGASRNVLATDEPIESIEDLEGFKIRLVQSPLKVDVWKSVGTIPTPISYLETYSALQSGTVDGMENESVAVLDMKFYEPAPYITRTEHEYTVRPLFMSNQTYDELPEQMQEVVMQAAAEATEYERQVERSASQDAEEQMKELGVEFYSIDMQPLREATAPVLVEYAETMGLSDLYDDIKSN